MKKGKTLNGDSEKLIKMIRLRISESEYNKLDEFSKKSGKDISKILRMIIKKSNLTIVAKTDVEAVIQIKKIGVNINQIAKKINQIQNDNQVLLESQRLQKTLDIIDETLIYLKK